MKNTLFLSALALLGLTGPALAQTTIESKPTRTSLDEMLKPGHQEWQSMPESTIKMAPQNIAKPMLSKGTFQELKVRSSVTKNWLLIRMEWEDPNADAELTRGEFSDACAVQFCAKGDAKDTSPFMGNPGKPVHILHWKAIWQADIELGYRDVEHGYPNMYVDYYPLAEGKKTEDIKGPALQYNPARSLNNPMSLTQRKQPMEELVAVGFGSATSQAHLDAKANGQHSNKKWSVVFARPLETPDPSDSQLKAGSSVPIAFALWDGATRNRGGRKHYCMWQTLKIGGTP